MRNQLHRYPDVGVHLKGQYGTFQNTEGKPSLTLNFDKFVPGQKFRGVDKLHLNNSVSDPTYMTEILCRELFRAAGVPVARAAHARVELNGRDAGLYVLVEGYNKTFLRRHFADAGGHLYDSEFMHDIDYPLKCSGDGGPPERSDLQALAAACEGAGKDGNEEGTLTLDPSPIRWERGGGERLRKLGAMVDLERFYSFLAVEIMTCHFDGYARGINNYWVYHEPEALGNKSPRASAGRARLSERAAFLIDPNGALGESRPTSASAGKLVFIPHGMDQMFYNPQSSLFPELKGVVAKAVLETPEGRERFRERCTTIFTNIFLRLTDRVEELRASLRPEVATLGTNAVAEYDRAVTDLQQRIRARLAHLQKHLLAPPPQLTPLKPGEELFLTNWLSSVEQGKAFMTAGFAPSPAEKVGLRSPSAPPPGAEVGRVSLSAPSVTNTHRDGGLGEARPTLGTLRARFDASEHQAVATWEARVVLPRGTYRFSTAVTCDQAIFRGPNCPVTIKLWGGADEQFESNRQDTRRVDLAQSFSITSDTPEEVLIQCQVQSHEAALEFQFGSLTLSRIQ
jgi:hypothetical protein